VSLFMFVPSWVVGGTSCIDVWSLLEARTKATEQEHYKLVI
jgi:hypothetical protein